VALLALLPQSTRWGWVVSVTPRPRFTAGERTPSTHWIGGWVGLRARLLICKIITKYLPHVLFSCFSWHGQTFQTSYLHQKNILAGTQAILISLVSNTDVHFRCIFFGYLGYTCRLTKNLKQDSRRRDRDMNLKPPEYESGVFTNQRRRSVLSGGGGALVVCMGDMYILNETWMQDKIYIW
jgi:hypothetical protein